MADLTTEIFDAMIEELKSLHEQKYAELQSQIDELKATPAAKPVAPKKEEKFKPEDAKNLSKDAKLENAFHFTLGSKNYKFLFGHVTVIEPEKAPVKITALAAQEDKDLQAALVKSGSGQIKQVF
jgi:hypothetical protein